MNEKEMLNLIKLEVKNIDKHLTSLINAKPNYIFIRLAVMEKWLEQVKIQTKKTYGVKEFNRIKKIKSYLKY